MGDIFGSAFLVIISSAFFFKAPDLFISTTNYGATNKLTAYFYWVVTILTSVLWAGLVFYVNFKNLFPDNLIINNLAAMIFPAFALKNGFSKYKKSKEDAALNAALKERAEKEALEEKILLDSLTPAKRKKYLKEKEEKLAETLRLEQEWKRQEEAAMEEKYNNSTYGIVIPELYCPHCTTTGKVRRKMGVTEETYLNSNNLYRPKNITKMHCDNCGTSWQV